MKNVLILGASGQIARWVINELAEDSQVALTLLLRNPKKLTDKKPSNAKTVVGDVMDKNLLASAVKGQDSSMPI